MGVQEILVYGLLGASVFFLAFKFLKPVLVGKKKNSCENDCNCK